MDRRQGAGRGPATLDFGVFLRTGRVVAARRPVEVKFNPYHDPRNGQFTFKPGGGSLGEIGRKYPRAAASVKQAVEREQKRSRC